MVSIMRHVWLVFFILLALAAPTLAAAAAANDPSGALWADTTLRQMSLEEKVGQLFMVWAKVDFMNFNGPDYAKLRDQMKKYHLGAFGITSPMDGGLLLKASPLDAAALTNQLQRDSDLPLFFAADFERGLPMRFHGGTDFPHAMAIGATGNTAYAYQFGRISAVEARAIGVHWNFYPDADVNSNPNNPIINTRSFGEDPARSQRDGQRPSSRECTTATAWPPPSISPATETPTPIPIFRSPASTPPASASNQVELPPFRAAIAAGVDSVMVGHLLVPSLEPDPNRVATISYNISTRLLQDELGFQGIVITDAMDMNGVTRIFGGNTPQSAGRAAVEAIKAGADYILIPGDLDGAYNGVLAAVKSGEIPESRIDESVAKSCAPRPHSACTKTASSISTPSTTSWPVRKTWPSRSRLPTRPSPFVARESQGAAAASRRGRRRFAIRLPLRRCRRKSSAGAGLHRRSARRKRTRPGARSSRPCSRRTRHLRG